MAETYSPGRREFLQLGIGATATTGAIAVGTRPASANVLQTTAGVGISGPLYLAGRVMDAVDHFTGLGEEDDEYANKQAETIYTQALYDVRTIKASNEQVLTSIENLVANAQTVAYQIGRGAYLESLNEGAAPAEALTDGKEAITNYIAPNQKNLVERWNQMAIQLETIMDQGVSIDSIDRLLFIRNEDGLEYNITELQTGSTPVTFVDGETETEFYYRANQSDYISAFNQGEYESAATSTPRWLGITDQQGGYAERRITSYYRFSDLWNELISIHDQAHAELTDFSDGIASSYNAGDISTEDITTPLDLFRMASDDADTPYAAADLAGLGLEVNQDSAIHITLLNDDTQLEGSVYLSKSPIGQSLAVGNVYDPTISRTTDADGNPNDTIDDYAATAEDPIPVDGLAYIAYNTDGGSTYSQIQQPFEVVEAVGSDGETLESVGYAPSTGQQTTTTDVDELRSELQAMNEEIIRLEQERAELATNSGGGGGGFDLSTMSLSNLPGLVILIGGAAFAAFLYGK